jgi:hypothetical protein
MTRPASTPVSIVLDQMRSLATRVITEHLNHDGVCVACGRRWPCEQVILADHNVAVAIAALPG